MQLIHATPAGVLVFFPSYAMLRSAQARWQLTDMWGRFEREGRKRVFCEADVQKQRDSQAAFTALVEGPSGYKAAAGLAKSQPQQLLEAQGAAEAGSLVLREGDAAAARAAVPAPYGRAAGTEGAPGGLRV